MAYDSGTMARYKRYDGPGGSGFHFYCELSGALVYSTRPMKILDEGEAVGLAWENEARQEFNYCTGCGRWVADLMYNADVLKCVDCVPWENSPRFCRKCGQEVISADRYCRACGEQLRYGET